MVTRDERGYIGVVVLMVLLVVSVLVGSALALGAGRQIAAAREYQRTQAYYIAEAGVAAALAQPGWLNQLTVDADGDSVAEDYTSDWGQFYYHDEPWMDGSLSVKVVRKPEVDGKNAFRLYSTGAFKEATCVLNVEARLPYAMAKGGVVAGRNVTVDGGGGVLRDYSAVSGNVRAGGQVTVKDGDIEWFNGDFLDPEFILRTSKILGEVRAKGDVVIENIGRVGYEDEFNGFDVFSEGDVTVRNASIVGKWGVPLLPMWPFCEDLRDVHVPSGSSVCVEDEPWRVLTLEYSRVRDVLLEDVDVAQPVVPPVSLEWARSVALPECCYEGDKTFATSDLQSMAGVWLVDGKVEISGFYSGRALIVASEDIEVTGTLAAQDTETDIIMLATPQNIRVENVGKDSHLLMWAGNDVQIRDCNSDHGVKVYGGILAGGDITVEDGSNFWYRPDLTALQPGGSGGPVEIVTWQEKYPVY